MIALRYRKAIIAAGLAAVTALESAYPTWHWLPAITAVIGAIGVYLVPNSRG